MSKKNGKNVEAEYQKVFEKDYYEKSDIPDSYGLGVRHVQIFLGFLSLAVGYIARAHIGVTVVAMTNTLRTQADNTLDIHRNLTENIFGNTTEWEDMDYKNKTTFDIIFEIDSTTNETVFGRRRNVPESNNSSEIGIFQKYDWPKSTQEMVLGSFFFGYTIMMIPMGIVCQKFGGKIPMQVALFVSGIATFVTPWMAAWGGWKAVVACRILQGLSQAGYYPGLQTLVAKWSPASELGKFYSWAFTGSTFGTVLAFQLAGLLANLGWPYIYWVMGSLCLVMFLIMTIFGAATPAQHKSISEMERKFILGNAKVEKKNLKVPLKPILSSRHVYAILAAHVGSTISFVFMFSQVPTYIHYILNVDVQNSGLISSLPYIASFITAIFIGPASDYLTNRNIITLRNGRRISTSIGLLGTALCFIGVSFTKNTSLAVFCLVMAMCSQAALHTGWMVNYIDLSPNFSGSLMSFGNTVSYIAVSCLPMIVSNIVTDVTNQLQWRIILVGMALVGTVANTIFVVFMSADKQPWNEAGYQATETEDLDLKAVVKS